MSAAKTLKETRAGRGLTLNDAAELTGVARSTLERLEAGWSVFMDPEQRLALIRVYGRTALLEATHRAGVAMSSLSSPTVPTDAPRRAGFVQTDPTPNPEEPMLWEKAERLSREELKLLKLPANPFPERNRTLFWWPELRETFNDLTQAVDDASMVALVAPSGSGKSSLLADLRDQLRQDTETVVVDLATTERQRMGAWTVETEMLLSLGVPKARVAASSDRRVKQIAELLAKRAATNARTVVIADDSHDLRLETMKGLRRLRELHPRYFLFSLVLAGQEGLAILLRSEELREVGGRTHLLEVPRLGGRVDGRELPNHGEAWIRWHFEQIGAGDAAARLFTPEGAQEIAAVAEHPLWCRNLAVHCLKLVAPLGRSVDGAVVQRLTRRGAK